MKSEECFNPLPTDHLHFFAFTLFICKSPKDQSKKIPNLTNIPKLTTTIYLIDN